MPIRIAYFGNSASKFSARYFTAVLEATCDLAAVVDVPFSRRGTTNPLPEARPDFVHTAREKGAATFEPDSPNDPRFVKMLCQLSPDLIIAAGYSLIFKEDILALPNQLAVNFHASLLPKYRGKHPVFWTLRGNERWAGLTVHAIDPGIDSGDILYQVKVGTRRDDTVASLYGRIMDRSVDLVGQLIADTEAGTIPRRAQPIGAGSYFSSITDEDYHLSWDWPAEKIRRHVTITPGKCYIEFNGQRLYFYDSEIELVDNPQAAGTLLRIGRTRVVVAARQGSISSSRVRAAGHDTESFAGFCRRMGLSLGERLTA